MKQIFFTVYVALIALFITSNTHACTNFIVTKGASTDGSVMISYSADSHVLYGELYHFPAAKNKPGTMRQIVNWDTGKIMGQIPEIAETFNVVGNVNEFQVSIGETTYGGREDLWAENGILDYGSLIYIALQRSKTAREAIKWIAELTAQYGYCSEGESFSIADKNEAWIFEMIGKGEGEKGVVWVARLIPDGYICAHANQARITTFAFQKTNDWFNHKQETFNSEDVITFARKKGYFNGEDKDFSFSDTYNPVTFDGTRYCDLRVWAFFNHVSTEMQAYWDYATGNDLKFDANGYCTNRMPLWIKPNRKISQIDMMRFMGDHLEGTALDMTKDFGAGPYECPYRWRPMTWKAYGTKFIHERTTGTQQTGFCFVAQLRGYLPDKIGAINWFGADDCANALFVPFIASTSVIPHAFAKGTGTMMDFTMESAFWITNLVTNFCYTRYNAIHPEIVAKQDELYKGYLADIQAFDAKWKDSKDVQGFQKAVNEFSDKNAKKFHTEWTNLFGYLFAKYLDGNIKTRQAIPDGHKYTNPKVSQPPFPDWYYKKIIESNGENLRYKGAE